MTQLPPDLGDSLVSGPLSKKLRDLQAIRTDTPEMLTAIAQLDDTLDDDLDRCRRHLRSTLECRTLESSKTLVEAFETTRGLIDRTTDELQTITQACDEAESELQDARKRTAGLMSKVAGLSNDRARAETLLFLCEGFLSRFQLTDAEQAALSKGPVNQEFLFVLERLDEVHAGCKALLSLGRQQAGLALLEALGSQQEAAYERLYHHVQAKCKQLADPEKSDHEDDAVFPDLDLEAAVASITTHGTPESAPLSSCVNVLSRRPVLLQLCVEEVENARKNAVLSAFIRALTRGGPWGTPRPIDATAHDPVRYVGDMLAWIHQTIASERELLTSVFRFHSEQLQPKSSRSTPDFETIMRDALDGIFAVLCRPFVSRFEQVLAQPSLSLVVCRRLQNVVMFYSSTIGVLLASEAALAGTLLECEEQCHAQSLRLWKDMAAQMQTDPPFCPADLGIPQDISEALQQLREVTVAFSESPILTMTITGTPHLDPIPKAAEKEFSSIFSVALEPMLQVCETIGRRRSIGEYHVFMLNVLSSAQGILSKFTFTAAQVQRLALLIEQHLDASIAAEISAWLEEAGVLESVRKCREGGQAIRTEKEQGPPNVTNPTLQLPVPVQEAPRVSLALLQSLRRFYNFLFERGEGDVVLAAVDKIAVPRLRSRARRGVLEEICKAHSDLHTAVVAVSTLHTEEIVLHDPAELAVMLGLQHTI